MDMIILPQNCVVVINRKNILRIDSPQQIPHKLLLDGLRSTDFSMVVHITGLNQYATSTSGKAQRLENFLAENANLIEFIVVQTITHWSDAAGLIPQLKILNAPKDIINLAYKYARHVNDGYGAHLESIEPKYLIKWREIINTIYPTYIPTYINGIYTRSEIGEVDAQWTYEV